MKNTMSNCCSAPVNTDTNICSDCKEPCDSLKEEGVCDICGYYLTHFKKCPHCQYQLKDK